MIEHIWLFVTLAFSATACCLYLLINLVLKKAGKGFVLLFINLILMNLAQGMGYVVWSYNPSLGMLFADIYLISAYFLFAHLFLFALGLSKKPISRVFVTVCYLYPVFLMGLHCFGLLVESYRIEQNSLMHNDGPMAVFFDIYVVFSCIGSAFAFSRNIKLHRGDQLLCSKNFIGLFSFVPLIIVFVVIVLLSMSNYAIAVGIVSPMITMYAAYTYYYLSRDRVADLSIGVGFFFDRLKLAYMLLETHKSKTDLKSYHKEVEKQFIIEALKEHNNRIYDTADCLGFNHTTLRKKIKEYEICLDTEVPLAKSAF